MPFSKNPTPRRTGGPAPRGSKAGSVSPKHRGYRPEEAKAMLDGAYSDPQKEAFARVQQADGFMGKLSAAVENPSVIAHTVAESVPSMLAGGVAARGLMGVGAAGGAAPGVRTVWPGGRVWCGHITVWRAGRQDCKTLGRG